MADGFSFDEARAPAGFSFEDAQKPVPFSFDDARGGDLPDSTEPTPYRRGYRNAPPALIDTPPPARGWLLPQDRAAPEIPAEQGMPPQPQPPTGAPQGQARDPRHPADWYPSQPTARQDGLAGTALGKIGQAAREGWQNSPATSPEWQYILDKSGWGGITRLLDSGMAVSNAAMRAAQETAVQIGTEIGMPRAGREVAGFMEYWMTGQGMPHAPEVPGFREGASEAGRNYAEAKAGDAALKDIAAGQPGTPAAAAPMPTLERMAAEARPPRTPEQAATEELAPGAAEPAAPKAPAPAPEPPQTAPEPEAPPAPREPAPVTPKPAAPFSFEEAATPPGPPEQPTSRATPWTPVPREPKRLIPYLRESTVQFPGTPHENVIPGGLQDMGGDLSAIIGGPRGRPGLINAAGRTLDDATLHAWEAGYMPEFSERPAINDLLEAIRDDHTGIARYSHYDFDDAQAYRDARAHNEEIGRLADQYGIPLKGITRDQFFDRVADHASLEDVAREAAEQSAAHEAEYAAAERAAWVAYHGTAAAPFERFDPNFIGTGEGAQAYGHGFYFGEEHDVARGYRDALEGQTATSMPPTQGSPLDIARKALDAAKGDRDAAIVSLNRRLNDYLSRSPAHQTPDGYDDLMKAMGALRSKGPLPGGHILTVRIRAKPEEMLDWDKPLSEQSPQVRAALERLGVPDRPHVNGEQAYGHIAGNALLERDMLQKMFRDRAANGDTRAFTADRARLAQLERSPPAAASDALRAVGIKGIRYLDATSRDRGEGTRNIVVFDHNDIEITHRNGEPVAPEAWNAQEFYGQSQARTLEDLENADRQEAAATAAQQRASGDGEPEPTPAGAGPVQEGGGPRGGGAGAGRGDAAEARGVSPPRHEQILAELDARNAPDADYRAAFSTGAKTPLRAGETWRQRLADWVASEKGAANTGVSADAAEIRQRMNLSADRIAAYNPSAAVSKLGRHWIYETYGGNPGPIFDTRKAAVAAAEAHKALKQEQYNNPTGYFDLTSLRATDRLERIRRYMAQGVTEIEAGRRANAEVPDSAAAQPAPATDLLGRPTPPPVTRPTPEPTIRNDARQTGLPGTEPSAVQAQAARDAGRGTLTGSAAQKPADEGLFAPDTSGQGKLLAQRQTETPEFRRWFGDSKVVDADGKPLVVYHGTPNAGFDTFSDALRGTRTGHNSADVGYHFTDSPEFADAYSASHRIGMDHAYESRFGKMPDGASDAPLNAALYPVHLSIKNPLRLPMSKDINGAQIEAAKRAGYDGIIANHGGGTEYVAFSPTQIKSAIGNRGTFDPTNPSVLYSFPAALFDPGAYRRIGGALAPHAAAAKAATTRLAESIATLFVPMRTGTVRSQAFAGTFANSLRQIMYRFGEIDREIERNFTPRQRDQMGRALDAQSVFEQGLRDRPAAEHDAARAEFDAGGTGLASLNPAQRRAVEMLDKLSQDAWRQMQERGMVDPNAAPLPYYFPRQLVRWSEENGFSRASSEGGAGRGIDARGQNLTTSGPMRREHLTPEETEAAARAKLGADVHLLRDIRSLPQRLAFTHRAIAGVDLMNQIERVGRDTGVDLVVKGDIPGLLKPADYFTMSDHPSFRRWTGTGWQALHVSKEFEGPLRAVLTQRSPLLYQVAQRLKGGVMSAIMYSPFIHLAVELGRSLPVMPGRILTLRALRDGSTLRRDLGYMDQATRDGLAPLGQGWHADPVSIADAAIVDSKTGFLAALGNARDAVANGAGRVGGQFAHDVVQHPHQTLLWDQVFNLQVGIYDEMRRRYVSKGFDPDVAGTMAAHIANRYAGALPSEHLSRGANMAANLLLFSRSFTLGNLGVMKDMFNGAPSHVRARIEQMAGPEVAKSAQSALRRKAISAVAMDIGLFYMANGLLQAGLQVLRNTSSQGLPAAAQQTYQQWLDEAGQAMSNARSNPLEAFGVLPQHWNEPGKQDRVFAGTDSKGRGVYLRLPPGKVGEEFLGWFAKPGVLLLNKSSPLVRPIIESVIGHDSLGRQIYKPDPQTIGDVLGIAGAVVKHIGEGLGPTSTIQGLREIWQQQVQGVPTTSDPYVSAAKVLGPLTGLAQVSSGFPGGPAAGEIHAQGERQRYDQQKAMPAIRSKIAAGDTDGAAKDMVALGMRQGEIKYYLQQTLAPGVTAGAMKRLQSMPPDTQDRVQRHLAP